MKKTPGLSLRSLLLMSLLILLLSACRNVEFAEQPASGMNLRLADLPEGWKLEAETERAAGTSDGEGLASAIVGLVRTSEAESWHVRVFTQEDATLAGMVMVFSDRQAAEEAMGHAPISTILDTPKEIAEFYPQAESEVTGEGAGRAEVVLQEERLEVGDETMLTWVKGGDSYALVVRNLNVICAVVGITTADGRELATVIADRIQ